MQASSTCKRDLAGKLRDFDKHADEAVTDLIKWLCRDRDELIAMARGRHVEGHYRYADGLMFEYGDKELLAETAQELADAIVYHALQIKRRKAQ